MNNFPAHKNENSIAFFPLFDLREAFSFYYGEGTPIAQTWKSVYCTL